MRQRRHGPAGFSMLELTVTVTVAGILLVVFVPSVAGLGHRAGLSVVGQQVATAISAARERAVARGGCTVVDLASSSTVRVQDVDLRDCEKAVPSMALTLPTPSMNARADASHAVTFFANVNNAEAQLVCRPNGYLRSNDYGASPLTLDHDDTDVWRLDIVDQRLPAGRDTLQVIVKPMGLVCVAHAPRDSKGECP